MGELTQIEVRDVTRTEYSAVRIQLIIIILDN